MMIRKAALIPNITKTGALKCALAAAEILERNGAEVYTDEGRLSNFSAFNDRIKALPQNELYDVCDVVIVFGGDGTVLGAAKRAAETGTPLLGVNFGHVGYITELEASEIETLERLCTGDYRVEDRMLLDVSIGKNGKQLFFARAFNETAITRGIVSRLADFTISCDGNLVSRYRADGIIVATPTGSTAYSMAAGGPVIDPTLELLSVTPVCSHSLDAARTLVFRPDSTIKVNVPSAKHAEAVVTVDGRSYFRLNDNDLAVSISRSDKKVRLIRFKNNSFGNTLYQKFGKG